MKRLIVNASRDQQLIAKSITPYTGEAGLYSSVVPDELSERRLNRLCEVLNIPTTEQEEFHCTIIYSPEATPDREVVMRNIDISMTLAQVVGLEMFGPKNDTLVLILLSHELATLHRKWRALGATPTFPNYMPHVTLQKPCSYTEDELQAMTARILNSEPITLRFLPEQVEDIS